MNKFSFLPYLHFIDKNNDQIQIFESAYARHHHSSSDGDSTNGGFNYGPGPEADDNQGFNTPTEKAHTNAPDSRHPSPGPDPTNGYNSADPYASESNNSPSTSYNPTLIYLIIIFSIIIGIVFIIWRKNKKMSKSRNEKREKN